MRVVLALLILATLAPAAHAASYSVPARGAGTIGSGGEGTIALADGLVVWVEERGTGAALVAAGEDGIARDVTTLPPVAGAPRFHSVAASGTTAFLQRHVCANADCRRAAAADLLRVDLATGVATPFDGCLGLATCQACSGEHLFNFSLRGAVLGITGRCTRDDGVIDLATGETRRVPERIITAAGRFAVQYLNEQTLIVSDWRTGATVTRVDNVSLSPGAREVALDEDGTLAWARDSLISVLAPGADQPRMVTRDRDRTYDVALAGGRLATRTGGAAGDATFQLDDRKVTGQRTPYGWAFDGTRLAWAAEPCGSPVVQVWDLATDPPPPADDRCIRARVVPASAKLSRQGAMVTVRLSRPPTPVRGCAGEVAADLFAGPALARTGWYEIRVPAGTTAVERLRVEHHGRLRGHKRLVARVKVDNRSGHPTNTRRRVRG